MMNTNNQKGFVNILIVLLVLAGGVYFLVESGKYKVESGGEENMACTMDAKMCPDGSYVGRVAPNCEFAECPSAPSSPSAEVKESNTAGINQKIFLGGGIYLTPIQVLADSRCPVDVTCIQAGDVTLRVRLEKDATSKEVEMKGEGSGVDFGPAVISLSDVSPEMNSKKPILEKDYKFTFKVDWKLD